MFSRGWIKFEVRYDAHQLIEVKVKEEGQKRKKGVLRETKCLYITIREIRITFHSKMSTQKRWKDKKVNRNQATESEILVAEVEKITGSIKPTHGPISSVARKLQPIVERNTKCPFYNLAHTQFLKYFSQLKCIHWIVAEFCHNKIR